VESVHGGFVSKTRPARHVYSALSSLESTSMVNSAEPVTLEFDLSTISPFEKIWGDPIPFHLIRIKTKSDWTEVEGQVNYVDMGNAWILNKFSTVQDREFVWFNRPWFITGLNLVLRPWVPMFDPCSVFITNVD